MLTIKKRDLTILQPRGGIQVNYGMKLDIFDFWKVGRDYTHSGIQPVLYLYIPFVRMLYMKI